MTFTEEVYAVVRKIPKGSTMTYKEVAKASGRPKAYRAVGNILNKKITIQLFHVIGLYGQMVLWGVIIEELTIKNRF